MSEGKYPVLFYEYAFSGKAKCHACVEKIKQGQNIFVFMGNLYHDICSKDFKERERLLERRELKETSQFGGEKRGGKMNDRKIGIVGAGTMGKSIAKLFAGNNFEVLLVDCVDKSNEIENGIAFAMDFGRLAECDFIIETVFEEVNAKKKALESISKYGKANAVVASNTSSMSIDLLSGFVSNKKNFLGVHFFNPANKMPLVEIVKGKETASETVSFAKGIVETAGKKTVVLNDSPGFIVNALLFPFLVDSINMSEEKKISCSDIDLAVKQGLNHPLGPFALMDLIGLDIVYDIMASLYEQTNDKKFKPPNVIGKLVKEKKLGRKTGSGFYEY